MWMIVFCVLFVLLGLLFVGLGWQIRKKRRMDLIISWHCDKVREENKPAYCALAGTGVLLMGIGFCFTGLCAPLVPSARVFIPTAAGLVSGISLFIAAGIRYNR